MTFKMKAAHGFYPHKDTFKQATATCLMDKLRKITVSLYYAGSKHTSLVFSFKAATQVQNVT